MYFAFSLIANSENAKKSTKELAFQLREIFEAKDYVRINNDIGSIAQLLASREDRTLPLALLSADSSLATWIKSFRGEKK